MLGWMDREALSRTLTEGRVTFWSRSRQEYWRKGDTSGHIQVVRGAALDCDADALLVRVDQTGAACHTGAHSCFDTHPIDAARRERRMSRMPGTTTVRGVLGRPGGPPRRPGRPRALRRQRDAARHLPQARDAGGRRMRPGTFLLESAEQGGLWSRYSFVGVAAFGSLTEQRGRPVWQDWGLPASRAFGAGGVTGNYLEALDDLHSHWASPRVEGLPPLTGGLVGYIGWDAVRLLERLPDAPPVGLRGARDRHGVRVRGGRGRPPEGHRVPHRHRAERRHRGRGHRLDGCSAAARRAREAARRARRGAAGGGRPRHRARAPAAHARGRTTSTPS